ncbi:MAG: hypothetical protein KGL46_11275 [Hyphomicrobiales bacterium]|nr:hypothetical protein [Hyphomicrobiales bacterium]
MRFDMAVSPQMIWTGRIDPRLHRLGAARLRGAIQPALQARIGDGRQDRALIESLGAPRGLPPDLFRLMHAEFQRRSARNQYRASLF